MKESWISKNITGYLGQEFGFAELKGEPRIDCKPGDEAAAAALLERVEVIK